MSLLTIVSLIAFLLMVPVVLFFGLVGVAILSETQYAYFWTLRRVRAATTFDGRLAIPVVAAALGTTAGALHVHTCSYCMNHHRQGRAIVHVHINARGSGEKLRFAYGRRTGMLVPGTAKTAERVPSMVPAGTAMVPTGGWVGGDTLMLPEPWVLVPPTVADAIEASFD